MEDINTFLAFEIKKEIAERYFGFRKIIEEDTHSYRINILHSSLDLENKIGIDLVRIFALFHSNELIQAFFHLVKLPERLFLDSHLNRSIRIKKNIFKGQTFRGITRKSCLKNMVFDIYKQLYIHINEYQDTLKKLSKDQATIREQINLFYKKNDISSILHFLNSLEGNPQSLSSHVQSDPGHSFGQNLNDKMRIHPPPEVEDLLPVIPSIPPFKNMRTSLKRLASAASLRRPEFDIRKVR